jgi:hypothetical protein
MQDGTVMAHATVVRQVNASNRTRHGETATSNNKLNLSEAWPQQVRLLDPLEGQPR